MEVEVFGNFNNKKEVTFMYHHIKELRPNALTPAGRN